MDSSEEYSYRTKRRKIVAEVTKLVEEINRPTEEHVESNSNVSVRLNNMPDLTIGICYR